MHTLTSGWSESSAAFQHDVYRSGNEGDFSPARGTYGPLLTHAWLHILLNTSTIYHLHAFSSHRINSTSTLYTADTCTKAKQNHWRLKMSSDFISSMCWDFMGLFLVSIFIRLLHLNTTTNQDVKCFSRKENRICYSLLHTKTTKKVKSYIFCIIAISIITESVLAWYRRWLNSSCKNVCLKCTPPQAIQNVDEFVTSSKQIRKNLASHHLLTNGSSAVNGCRQNKRPNSW